MTQLTPYNHIPPSSEELVSTNNLVIQMKNKLAIGGIKRIKLIVTLFADKAPHKPTAMDTLKRTWAQYGTVNITDRDERDPDDKILIATAQDEEVAKSILDNSPWSVIGFNVHVQEWPAIKAIEDIPTHHISFWIQIRGVPLYLFMEENARDMVSQFGVFISMDDPLEGEDGTYSFLRVRVLFDGTKPLPSGFKLPREDGSVSWVEFKYEKLANFCYKCGRLGHNHTLKFPCTRPIESQDDEEAYGDWMSIPTFRQPVRQPHHQEFEASRTSRRRRAGQLMSPFGSGIVGQNFNNHGQSSANGDTCPIVESQSQSRFGHNNSVGFESQKITNTCSLPHQCPSNDVHLARQNPVPPSDTAQDEDFHDNDDLVIYGADYNGSIYSQGDGGWPSTAARHP
ncbi:hypothetical protein M0R45_006862 [Rubus argutus]|uniref:Zinc knuckle CX2CX4HX4C domain-containing protein n=1 Tax=Rubus argutus TaxID=59490 RepID=A0AAW1YRS7_RUBAR